MSLFARLLVVLAIALAALVSVPIAVARAGLDPAFGSGGKVLTPPVGASDSSVFAGVRMALRDDGVVLLADAHEVVAYRPDGSLDQGFEQAGRLAIALPPGAEFLLGGLAVDPVGRIVLAGTARYPSSAPSYGLSSGPEYALIYRYLPSGRPDPGFGDGTGMVQTDLGLPAPLPGSGGTAYQRQVRVSDLALDPAGRILLSGAYLEEVAFCRASVDPDLGGYLARLSLDGSLDRGFGGEGFRIYPSLEEVRTLRLLAGNSLQVIAERGGRCEPSSSVLSRLGPDGLLDRNVSGWRETDSGRSLAVDRRGRVLATGAADPSPKWIRRHPHSSLAQVERLTPAGRLDLSFGRRGRAKVLVPGLRSFFSTIAVEPGGGVLLGGSHLHPHGRPRGATFMLARLDANGHWDRGFGPGGRIETRFGRGSSAVAGQALLDPRGGLLMAGRATSPRFGPGVGFALARYVFPLRRRG